MARFAAVLISLSLAASLPGCGGDAPPPQVFAPLHYEYLTKIRLTVGQVEIRDQAAPLGPDDLAGQAPVPPAQALEQLGRDRLFAAGGPGTAIFTIEQASLIRQPDGSIAGQLAVRLDIIDASGRSVATAEARVARQHVPGSDEDLRAILYGVTKQMLDDMNVELEFQVRRSLKAFLVAPGVAEAPVAAQPLTPTPTPTPTPLPAPVAPSPAPEATPSLLPSQSEPLPPAVPPDGTGPVMSPPPGVLQLPPGYTPPP